MKLAICQLNPTVGDFRGNLALLADALGSVSGERPDLAVFPEMFLTGYPPQDLLEREWFVERAESALADLLASSRAHPATAILAGTITRSVRPAGKGLHNSALLIRDGAVLSTIHKLSLIHI